MVDKARVEEAERRAMELETMVNHVYPMRSIHGISIVILQLHQVQTQCYDLEQKLTQANEQYLSAQESYDTKIRKLEEEKRQLNHQVSQPCVFVCMHWTL